MIPAGIGFKLDRLIGGSRVSEQTKIEELNWSEDRFLLKNLLFRLEHSKSDSWDGGEDYFMFYKTKYLVDEYADYLSRFPIQPGLKLFELGIFDGGSTVFWNEILKPSKHVAADILDREDSAYFKNYLEGMNNTADIKTFWRTNQADKSRLLQILFTELGGTVDVIIDDASHLYEPTLASFEALFPFLSPNGVYILEDWPWEHWQGFGAPDHPWRNEESLTKLVTQFIEATGSGSYMVSNVMVYRGFVVLRKSHQVIQDPFNFKLEEVITRRR